jgi:type II secretory pathway pseudopilin PulG
MEPKSLATPDVTWVQGFVAALTGVIIAAIAVVNSFGWVSISVDQSAKLLALWTALGAAAVFADAHIRNGRARAFAIPPKGVVADDDTATVQPTTLRKPVRRAPRKP